MEMPIPPAAQRIPQKRSFHGDTVIDEFAWLAEADHPDTTGYIAAENTYAEARTAGQDRLRAEVFREILTRTAETDLSVPARKGGYWYYYRVTEGQQYETHCRIALRSDGELPPATDGIAPLADELILLDGNALAADSGHFMLGTLDVSPDGQLLAYSVDLAGDECFSLRIKDLRTGLLLPDEIGDVYYGSAWSLDGSALFYVTVDAAGRPGRVWRHQVGTSADTDVLVFDETDERYWVSVELSRSQKYIIIESRSVTTSEVRIVPSNAPGQPPRLIQARREGVDYSVDHDARRSRFLIVHNDGAEDFELAWAHQDSPGTWHPLVPHERGSRLIAVIAFADAVVLSLRHDGLSTLRVLEADSEQSDGPWHEISFPEPVYTVALDRNLEYETAAIRLRYVSLITPESVFDYHLATRELKLRKQVPVQGGYDSGAYEQRREWARADDGTRIPISLVYRRGRPFDGSAPAVLYGYGAYEECVDPRFSIPRLSLLDRGFLYAVAHVRGGGELGRHWYTEGRLLKKKNTFTDFIACARHLVKAGWTRSDRLIARGTSAGGLLMGVIANTAPEDFAGIVVEAPFVDPLTTLLDPELPLTVTEWDEWGNPLESAEAYAYLKSYSPYENVAPVNYPAIAALASRNDSRVLVREPLKWIARLRAVAPGGDYLLATDLSAGHGGRSGRYDRWHREAFIIAWMVSLAGLPDSPGPPAA
jgi:oligopeptidase B